MLIPSNADIVDFEYLWEICFPIFVVDDFSRSIFTSFYLLNQRLNICLNIRYQISGTDETPVCQCLQKALQCSKSLYSHILF